MNCSDHQHERGAELVEMALIMPLFLALVISIMNLDGRITSTGSTSHTQQGRGQGGCGSCLTGGNCTPGSADKQDQIQNSCTLGVNQHSCCQRQ